MQQPLLDCLVVGGGPAGLTAAIYLSRFHLDILVVDAGDSRAALIPKTRNHAGYPEGIAGPDLLARMAKQAELYGTRIERAAVETLERDADDFVAGWNGQQVRARTVLLATGVVNHRPAMDDATHDEALRSGLLRYCPICDGYEVTDRKVAVIGTGERGFNEAIFLRGYTADLTLIAPDGAHDLGQDQRAKLAEAGVAIVDGPARAIRIDGDRIAVGAHAFDSIYPAMGSDIRSELVRGLGADMTEDGCLSVDDHQRTNVDGLYAAGDVVKGLDQISHAMGEGGVAATTIRNDLAKRVTLYR